METLESNLNHRSIELVDGRAVRAIGIGLCETSVVLSPAEEARLNEDLEDLSSQARSGVRYSEPSELVYY